MRKFRFLLLLVLVVCISASFVACNKVVKFKIDFVVDEQIYQTVDTVGNEVIQMPENPTKDGCVFDGWYWDKNVWSKPFTANSLLDAPLSSNMSVYAKWQAIQCYGGHTKGQPVKENEILPTCTKSGSYDEVFYCLVCEEEIGRTHKVIEKLGHDLIHHDAKAPDYENTGWTEYDTCSRCDYSTYTELPKLTDKRGAMIISAKNMTVNNINSTCFISLPYATTTFSLINEFTLSPYAKWVLSSDIYGMNTIVTKTVPLDAGNNVYYALITSGDEETINLYTITIRRRPIYTVNFITNGGTSVDSQYVEETHFATEPTTTRAGYTFVKWSYDFTQPIMGNQTISASWRANTDTAYKTEYYLQNLADDNYTLTATDNLSGTTDTTANAVIKSFEHFTYSSAKSTISGNIDGSGNLVLKVYYTRNTYTVSVSAGNNVSVTNAISGTYKYGYEYAGSVATFNNYLAYEWDGWYVDDIKTNDNSELNAFIVSSNVVITAQSKLKEGMQNFIFTTDETTCEINGVKDTTVMNITVPNCVTKICDRAFDNCSELTMIYVSEANTVYSSKDGILYNKAQTEFVHIPENIQGSIAIPDGIKSIGWSAFSDRSGLTSITIPDSVTSIGDSAFRGCSELTTVNWNVTACTSVANDHRPLFGGCTKLSTVNIGNNVTTIPSYAFEGCSGITSIYYMGDIAGWCGINGLSHLMSSSHTLYIGGKKVEGELVIPDSVKSIGERAFFNCSGLTSVTIPNSVKIIRDYAFVGCSGLKSVTIPDSVIHIGAGAFHGCSGLTKITLPFVGASKTASNGENRVFGYIFGFTISNSSTILDATCQYERNGMYYHAHIPSSLKLVTITGGDIPSHAFYNCNGLTNITISNSVTSIGGFAFYNCGGLTSLNYSGTKVQWQAISKGADWNTNTPNYVIYCTDGTIAK